jgi:hypothetical protein
MGAGVDEPRLSCIEKLEHSLYLLRGKHLIAKGRVGAYRESVGK